MDTKYKHTQFGVLTFIILLLPGVLVAPITFSMLADGRVGIASVILGLFLLILALFFAFTVEISDSRLRFWFGIGGIRKSYLLEEIRSAQEVKNPWYYLWGVKSIPGGWLYAIAPGSAVEILLKNGKIIRLGTNEPKKLKLAIDNAITGI